MNLTWAQVGCILKYTRPAGWGDARIPQLFNEKPGYYLSEEAYIERLRKELSLTPNGRFPLTWIMEAADDISYCVADSKTPLRKEYSASRSFISIFMLPGETMKKGRCLLRLSKMPGKIALKFIKPQHGRSVLYVFAGQYIK
jgi:dGTP triphosphohydrolase